MSNSFGRTVERQQLKKKFREYLHGPWHEQVFAQRLQIDAGVKVTMDHRGQRFVADAPMLPARPRFRQFVKMVKRQLSVMAQLKAEALKAKSGPEAKETWEDEGDLLVETGPIETTLGAQVRELLDEEFPLDEAPVVPLKFDSVSEMAEATKLYRAGQLGHVDTDLPSAADVAAIDTL